MTNNPLWTGFCDGSCQPNPGTMGLGAILYAPDGSVAGQLSQLAGEGTVNRAEYGALAGLLAMAREAAAGPLLIRTDSQLLVNQVTGKWGVKDEALAEELGRVHHLMAELPEVQIEWLSRDYNTVADELAKGPVEGSTRFPAGIDRVVALGAGCFLVRGASGEAFVDVGEGTCTCEEPECPHREAVDPAAIATGAKVD